jgi:hypothetical protein
VPSTRPAFRLALCSRCTLDGAFPPGPGVELPLGALSACVPQFSALQQVDAGAGDRRQPAAPAGLSEEAIDPVTLAHVRFELQGALPIDSPTPRQVEEGLHTLESAERDYAILEQDAETYLQTAPNGRGAYQLEFRDGSEDQHLQALHPLQLDDLIAAFGAYLRQDAGWRSPYEWKKLDITPPPPMPHLPHRERRQMSRSRVAARLGVGLVWGLTQAAILVALFLAGGLVGAIGSLVAPSVYGLPVSIGFTGGVVAGLVVNHYSRMWLLQLRLRLLRRRGRRVMANVVWVDEQYVAPRGPGATTYTVFVQWHDPVSGVDHEYERQYRFWGMGSNHFEAVVDEQHLPVLYAPSRPSRFVIDIPFAPTSADFVLSERPGQVQPGSAPARPARTAAGHRPVAEIVFYAVLGAICLFFGAGALASAGEAARTGLVGPLVVEAIIGLVMIAGAASCVQTIYRSTRAAPTGRGAGAGGHQAPAQRRTTRRHRPNP